MRRLLELMGLAAVIVVVIVLLKLAPVPTAQAPAATAKTSWGEPDLQGIWTNDYEIPLQRSARYARGARKPPLESLPSRRAPQDHLPGRHLV